MDKHTYLIIAHNNFGQLAKLIELLDDKRNDIYLHVHKKMKNFNPQLIQVNKANLYFTERTSVTWGT